jgi:antitoxin (DNA-binding transcriptional repressor) of toxin-antitoxin stability system
MRVSIAYAEEHFEDLVAAVQAGETFEIECEGGPGVRLAAFTASEPEASVVE